MKKIMLVFGTRPEAIKMCPLVKIFQKYKDKFEVYVCVTGQHRQMLDQVLKLFDIEPDFDLNIMKHGQDLYDVTTRVLVGMRDVLQKVKPDVVLVHGDTTTSTASALAAFYQQISVGHVEAGLRTYNIYSPWPEEMNRQLTSRIAKWHFAPTVLSKENLLREGIKEECIFVTGNTVIDALKYVLGWIKKEEKLQNSIIESLGKYGIYRDLIEAWRKQDRNMVLITGHRRENFGEGFENICRAIKQLAKKFPNTDFVYPMHLNPNVRDPLFQVFPKNYRIEYPNVYLIEPLDYLPFVFIMHLATLVLTDSGGIQEEAPGLGIPVLVMRDTTERPEAVKAGTVKLVGTNSDIIMNYVSELLAKGSLYNEMKIAQNPYGDGKSSERIVSLLGSMFYEK